MCINLKLFRTSSACWRGSEYFNSLFKILKNLRFSQTIPIFRACGTDSHLEKIFCMFQMKNLKISSPLAGYLGWVI